MMGLVPEGDEEGVYTETFRVGLLEARLDILGGRLIDHADMKRRLGI